MQYIEYKIDQVTSEISDILVALLSNIGFETFNQEESCLYAYIDDNLNTKLIQEQIETYQQQFHFNFSFQPMTNKNWNAEWESNFQPVIVAEQCIIKATFHKDLPKFPFEIIIEPRMAFGTGHHASTYTMIESMLNIDFKNLDVCDAGCGTGVLSIMAALKGAKSIIGIDNNDWAFNNALDNLVLNGMKNKVKIELGELELMKSARYDIILANINRNIILDYLPMFSNLLKGPKVILLSGILLEDEQLILERAISCGLSLNESLHREGWTCLTMQLKD